VEGHTPWKLDILLGEDTPSDIELFQMALTGCGGVQSLNVVRDGRDLLRYLQGKPPFEPGVHPRPNHLKMPKVDGFQILEWLKSHPECSVIPTVVFSSSKQEEDVQKAYKLGANAFFEKPSDFAQLEHILRAILDFWSCAQRPAVKEPVCR
jgi:CheY-like chemotaxis protein